jgi:hypothetical protein
MRSNYNPYKIVAKQNLDFELYVKTRTERVEDFELDEVSDTSKAAKILSKFNTYKAIHPLIDENSSTKLGEIIRFQAHAGPLRALRVCEIGEKLVVTLGSNSLLKVHNLTGAIHCILNLNHPLPTK